MVFIHVYYSKAWLVDDYRDPAFETNITTTVTGAATWDPLLEPNPKIRTLRGIWLPNRVRQCAPYGRSVN